MNEKQQRLIEVLNAMLVGFKTGCGMTDLEFLVATRKFTRTLYQNCDISMSLHEIDALGNK